MYSLFVLHNHNFSSSWCSNLFGRNSNLFTFLTINVYFFCINPCKITMLFKELTIVEFFSWKRLVQVGSKMEKKGCFHTSYLTNNSVFLKAMFLT